MAATRELAQHPRDGRLDAMRRPDSASNTYPSMVTALVERTVVPTPHQVKITATATYLLNASQASAGQIYPQASTERTGVTGTGYLEPVSPAHLQTTHSHHAGAVSACRWTPCPDAIQRYEGGQRRCEDRDDHRVVHRRRCADSPSRTAPAAARRAPSRTGSGLAVHATSDGENRDHTGARESCWPIRHATLSKMMAVGGFLFCEVSATVGRPARPVRSARRHR